MTITNNDHALVFESWGKMIFRSLSEEAQGVVGTDHMPQRDRWFWGPNWFISAKCSSCMAFIYTRESFYGQLLVSLCLTWSIYEYSILYIRVLLIQSCWVPTESLSGAKQKEPLENR